LCDFDLTGSFAPQANGSSQLFLLLFKMKFMRHAHRAKWGIIIIQWETMQVENVFFHSCQVFVAHSA